MVEVGIRTVVWINNGSTSGVSVRVRNRIGVTLRVGWGAREWWGVG